MENIFINEKKVVKQAEKLLRAGAIETENDIRTYGTLLEEYKKLLRQFVMLVKISDINQSELNSLLKKLEAASNIDTLTGLFNRRYFNNMYEKEWLSSIRPETPLSALMIDIDFFKKYNDEFGHLQGDECLKRVADAIRMSVFRPRDIVARFGGEEFVVILPDTPVKGAEHVAGSIISNVERLTIPHPASPVYQKVTVSIGIASMVPSGSEFSVKLINLADNALYDAKHAGRNCYRVYCDEAGL